MLMDSIDTFLVQWQRLLFDNIVHFFDIQGQQKLKFLTMHMKRNDDTGKLINIALQHMQLSVGSVGHFFHLPYDDYYHLLPWT